MDQQVGQQAKRAQRLRLEEQQTNMLLYEEQQKLIRGEIEEQSPLVGDLNHISLMLDEFVNNQGFYIKVQKMHNQYTHYRKTRRDGSCFYRAFTFSIMQAIHINKDKKLQQHLLDKIKNSKDLLLKAKFEGLVFEDILDLFVDKLKDTSLKKVDDVLDMMRDPGISNYLVLMLRYITSAEIKVNPTIYETFIDNQIPVEIFCQLEVEPIDKEADQIQIMALLNYLGVAIKIIYLDANPKNKEPYEVILPESINKEQIKATLLYRPGHYDILYGV